MIAKFISHLLLTDKVRIYVMIKRLDYFSKKFNLLYLKLHLSYIKTLVLQLATPNYFGFDKLYFRMLYRFPRRNRYP